MRHYAKLAWTTQDVIDVADALDIDMTEDDARAWWRHNEKHFRDRLCELGNEVMTLFVQVHRKHLKEREYAP